MSDLRRATACAALLLGSSGCPVTDDYFLSASTVKSDAAGDDGGEGGGSSEDGGVSAGAAGASTLLGGSSNGGYGASTCMAAEQRCNTRDDDCDGVVDERACPDGCEAFTLPGAPTHAYLYCRDDARADGLRSRATCGAHGMRLAWLNDETKNSAVAAKLAELTEEWVVLIGATDIAVEGEWSWVGGAKFWRGGSDGSRVGSEFSAWAQGVPNDTDDEDCGVLNPARAKWWDHACDQALPFLCEDADGT